MRKNALTTHEMGLIRAMRREDPTITCAKVAEKLGRAPSTVARWAAKNGIPFEGHNGPKVTGPISEFRRQRIIEALARKKANGAHHE